MRFVELEDGYYVAASQVAFVKDAAIVGTCELTLTNGDRWTLKGEAQQLVRELSGRPPQRKSRRRK